MNIKARITNICHLRKQLLCARHWARCCTYGVSQNPETIQEEATILYIQFENLRWGGDLNNWPRAVFVSK